MKNRYYDESDDIWVLTEAEKQLEKEFFMYLEWIRYECENFDCQPDVGVLLKEFRDSIKELPR